MIPSSRPQIDVVRQQLPTGGLLPENPIKLLAQQVFTTVRDLIFPPFCVACNRVGSFLCPQCLATLSPARPRTVIGLEGVQAAVAYEGAIRQAIHALKYDKKPRVAEPLSRVVIQSLTEVDWQIDFVTAVPLHDKRLRERGYNQSALIGQLIARHFHLPMVVDALQRQRETASQVELSAQDRQANVEGAFTADPSRVKGKRILVIDDVLTTGATLAACAQALYTAGAVGVYGATVAGSMYVERDHTGTLIAPV